MEQSDSGDFDRLVERLPAIAEAISVFDSPEVQAQAFNALASAYLGHTQQQTSAASHGSTDPDLRSESNKPDDAQVLDGLSIGEYLTSVDAQRMVDKITAIAAWIIDNGNQKSVDRDDIKAEFQNAGEAVPGPNYARDFKNAIKVNFLAVEPNTDGKCVYVTRTGRSAIAGKFAGDARKAVPVKKPGKKKQNATG